MEGVMSLVLAAHYYTDADGNYHPAFIVPEGMPRTTVGKWYWPNIIRDNSADAMTWAALAIHDAIIAEQEGGCSIMDSASGWNVWPVK